MWDQLINAQDFPLIASKWFSFKYDLFIQVCISKFFCIFIFLYWKNFPELNTKLLSYYQIMFQSGLIKIIFLFFSWFTTKNKSHLISNVLWLNKMQYVTCWPEFYMNCQICTLNHFLGSYWQFVQIIVSIINFHLLKPNFTCLKLFHLFEDIILVRHYENWLPYQQYIIWWLTMLPK